MKVRPTRAMLRAEGRAAERADTLAAIGRIRRSLSDFVSTGKLDAEGATWLDRRLAMLADQLEQGLHEGQAAR